MPYPPVIPPATRTDVTDQAANHAADHNALSQALTDMVAALPRGRLGFVSIASGQLTFTTQTDLAGMTLTVTVPAGRRLRLTFFGYRVANDTENNQSAILRFWQDGANLTAFHVWEGFTWPTGGGSYVNATWIVTPTAGAHTFKVTGERNAGAATHYVAGSAYFMVEDIGT